MKNTTESLSKRGILHPFAIFLLLFAGVFTLFPVYKVQADPSVLSGAYVIREFSGGRNGGSPDRGWGSDDEWTLGNIVVNFDGQGHFSATSSETGVQRHMSEMSKSLGSVQDPDYVLSNTFSTQPTSYSDPGVSGSYEVTADGRFTLSFQDMDVPASVSGWVSQNGQMVVFGESEYEPTRFSSGISLAVGVKKGASMPSTISATYVLHEFCGSFSGQGPNGGWGSSDQRSLGNIEITFNSDTTFSATSTDFYVYRTFGEMLLNWGTAENPDRVLSNLFTTNSGTEGDTVNGTYTITSEGQFTLNFLDDGQPASLSGWVSENGQSVVFGQTHYDPSNFWSMVSLGAGVKKGSALNVSSVWGTYGIFTMDSGVYGWDSNGGWGTGDELSVEDGSITINPDGTWSVTSSERGLQRDIQEISENWGSDEYPEHVLSDRFYTKQRFYNTYESGTYTFSGNGTLSLNFVEDGQPGSVVMCLSEDGQAGVFGFKEFNPTEYNGSAGLGVAVRKAVQSASSLTYSIAGQVTYTGGRTGTLRVIAFYNNGGRAYPYAQPVGTPYVETWDPDPVTHAQPYIIRGLPPGTYQLVAYLDADAIGPRQPGEPIAVLTGIVVSNSNLVGQDLTMAIPGFQFSGQEKVYPVLRGDQSNDLHLGFWARIPDVSALQVTGPGIATPIGLQPDTMDSTTWSIFVPVSSLSGGVIQTGSYQFTATSAVDSSQLNTSFNLTSVPGTPSTAGLVNPYEGTPNKEILLTIERPTFTWNPAAGAQAQKLRVDQQIEGQWVRIYDSAWGVSGNTHTAQMPLPSGVPLRWYVDAYNGTDWPSSTAMSRSVRQRFTIAGPRSISGTVNVPGYSGSGTITISIYLSEDGTFNPASQTLLGTDVISPGEYNAGLSYYVVPNLPVGALVYVSAQWDADGNGVLSDGDYLGKIGPLTVTADGLLNINLSLETRYAEDQGAPFFAWCSVQALNAPKTGGGSEIQTSLNARVVDPNGTLPGTIQSLTVTGPGVNYTFTSADYQQSINSYYYGFVAQPTVGEYTFTVTDAEGKTATSHCYYGGGTVIPLLDSTTLQASNDGQNNVILSWGAVSGYEGNLFYRARIYDGTGVNVIWTSDLIPQTSVMVPAHMLSLIPQDAKWRVEAFDNYTFPAADNRALSGKVSWVIDNSKPYFNYATIFHRKDSGGDKTMIQASVAAPGGSLPASIQSIDVYTPLGALLYSLQAGNYDAGFNEYSYAFSGTPATGIYRFVVTDTNANTKTTYDYVSSAAIPMVDAATLQTSGDLPAPFLSWGAPAGMDRPLYYRAIVEQDLGGGVFSRVWASGRITDTFVQVPAGVIPSGTIVWYVRSEDNPYFVNVSNQGRSSRVSLGDNFATTNAKPYFRRVAVYKRYEPGGVPYIFMDAMVNDPNGWVPGTIAVLKVTDPDGVEYDLLPPNGTYSSPSDQEFVRKVPGTPKQGVYTFTLQDEEENTAVTRDWVGTAADIPLVPSTSIVILGDPMSPTVSWSAVSGYQGKLYYRIYVQDSEGNLVYRSSRDPVTAQTIPSGMLTAGKWYSVRVEAQDHWMFGVYNCRSNSDWAIWSTAGGVVTAVSGRVTDSDENPIANLQVYAQSGSCQGAWLASTSTDQDGNYTLYLPAGEVVIRACASCSGLGYVDEWYDNVYGCDHAAPVSVVAGEAMQGIDFTLDPAGFISGHVFEEDRETPVANVQVYAQTSGLGNWVAGTMSDGSGFYSLNVPAGTYIVRACATCTGVPYIDEWYENPSNPGVPEPVSVTPPDEVSGIDFTLAPQPVPGDMDGDRVVTLADAIMGLKLVTGQTPAVVNNSAHVDLDGKLGMVEVIYVLQKVSGVRP